MAVNIRSTNENAFWGKVFPARSIFLTSTPPPILPFALSFISAFIRRPCDRIYRNGTHSNNFRFRSVLSGFVSAGEFMARNYYAERLPTLFRLNSFSVRPASRYSQPLPQYQYGSFASHSFRCTNILFPHHPNLSCSFSKYVLSESQT